MDDSIIPPIPDFLKAKNRPKPRKPREVKDKWAPIKKKETRATRRQMKDSHDKMVVAAVRGGADTFQKIRKELNNEGEPVRSIESNEISNALRRSIKSRHIRKDGRRYYPWS